MHHAMLARGAPRHARVPAAGAKTPWKAVNTLARLMLIMTCHNRSSIPHERCPQTVTDGGPDAFGAHALADPRDRAPTHPRRHLRPAFADAVGEPDDGGLQGQPHHHPPGAR